MWPFREGVETAAQDRGVVTRESDVRQGIHFTRPMTPEMLDKVTSSEIGMDHLRVNVVVLPNSMAS